ncbi:MAG: pyridoxamine 5'-phosphate oxidase family protein [Anaerolineaceae bacterium]|nr:MAG: pyridoxamine 5'-phosphate oxidase family protein [Anaerolineaceae bacterium]
MTSTMSKSEREQFLAGLHVGVFSVAEEGRGPLTVPVWYAYEPGGEVAIWIGAESRKAQLLQVAERFTLCVQDEQPPYRYVSVEGPVSSVAPVNLEEDVRPLAQRYLGPEAAEPYLASLGGPAGVANDILVRMRPQRWYSADFSS